MNRSIDPAADAAAASAALHQLALASKSFDDPATSYSVLGDLLSCVGSLRQVVRQVADLHRRHVDLVSAENPRGDGRRAPVAAARSLGRADGLLDAIEDLIDTASQESSRIVWRAQAEALEDHPVRPTTAVTRRTAYPAAVTRPERSL